MKHFDRFREYRPVRHGVAVIAIVIVMAFGMFNIHDSSAATAPSGNFTCASNTTAITLTVTWANAGGGIAVWRYGMSTPLYTTKTVTYSNLKIDGKAAGTSNTSYTYELRLYDSTGKETSHVDHVCATKPKPATVSLSCNSSTTSSITVNVGYNNPDLSTSLYIGPTLAITYPKGAQNTTRTQSSLSASTSYTFKLDPGAAGTAVSVTCTTSDPPPAPAPAPTPDPTAGSGTTDTSTDTSSTDTSTDTSTDSSSSDTSSSDNSGVQVVDNGSGSSSVDGVTLDDGSSSSSDTPSDSTGDSTSTSSNNSTTSTGSGSGSRLNGKKTSATKTVVSALGVIALMIIGFFGWLFLRGRRLNNEQDHYASAYNTINYAEPASQVVSGGDVPPAVDAPYAAATYTVPTTTDQVPLPPPPAVPPAASNKMESIINSTFYPGAPQQSVPGETPKDNVPLDMFEVANQYPTSFGNSHVVSPLTPTARDLMPDTSSVPQPTTMPLAPAEPAPVVEADGTLDLHPAAVTPSPAPNLIPLPPTPPSAPVEPIDGPTIIHPDSQ